MALAKLDLLRLLSDELRAPFFAAVAQQMCVSPPMPRDAAAASLRDGFGGLDFTDGEPAQLLLSVKVVIARVSSRIYQEGAAEHEGPALQADLEAAGLAPAAAKWVREAAEAAVSTCAEELRQAQSHAAASFTHDYLTDIDWQVNHVLSSSELNHINSPLVQLQLRIRKAGIDGHEVTEHLELSPSELDTMISELDSAASALRAASDASAP